MGFETRLKSAREAAGLTQVQAAKALGTYQVTVSRWETAKMVPPTERLVKIADALGVHVEWLATGEGPRRKKPRHAT